MECVILAGGLGTRLRSVVGDSPKCMAPVAGNPFVHYLVEALEMAGFDHIVFSLGYRSEDFSRWLSSLKTRARIEAVVETEPLGTGGAVRFAGTRIQGEDFFVLNGDTFLSLDYRALWRAHLRHRREGVLATLALKPMRNFDRYGTVSLSGGRITAFGEKCPCDEGLINAGVCVVAKAALAILPERCSLERDFFEVQAAASRLGGFVADGYFIDIGIPDDYRKAQDDFSLRRHAPFDTLVLDRDGVINYERKGDYVKCPAEMVFIPGSLEAIARIRPWFTRIVIATNQRGIGRGIMTHDDLARVHAYLCAEVERCGGRIDRIYYSTGIDSSDPCRKPNPGMACQIRKDYPEADFSRSFMVGDKESDMEFAARASLTGIRVSEEFPLAAAVQRFIDRWQGREEPSCA